MINLYLFQRCLLKKKMLRENQAIYDSSFVQKLLSITQKKNF